MWPKYLTLATFAYNAFSTPNLENYSPYAFIFGRKPRRLLNLDSNPDIKVLGTFKEYYELLNKRLKYGRILRGLFEHERLKAANKHEKFKETFKI